MTLCEMCRENVARWHQERPVDRWLCNECAKSDQRATYPKSWQGEYHGGDGDAFR